MNIYEKRCKSARLPLSVPVFRKAEGDPAPAPEAEARTVKCETRGCEYYQGDKKCGAFPDGIPDRIAYGDDLHATVADDQTGDMVYQKKEAEA